jgi:hypothetical protein
MADNSTDRPPVDGKKTKPAKKMQKILGVPSAIRRTVSGIAATLGALGGGGGGR